MSQAFLGMVHLLTGEAAAASPQVVFFNHITSITAKTDIMEESKYRKSGDLTLLIMVQSGVNLDFTKQKRQTLKTSQIRVK